MPKTNVHRYIWHSDSRIEADYNLIVEPLDKVAYHLIWRTKFFKRFNTKKDRKILKRIARLRKILITRYHLEKQVELEKADPVLRWKICLIQNPRSLGCKNRQ